MKSLSIKIDNDYDFQFQKDFKKILKRFQKVMGLPKKICVDVLVTNNKTIRKISKSYRNIDKETDVLSFPMFEKKEIKKLDNKNQDILGDIVISIEKVKEQAVEYEHSFERELAYMAVHGFYHLMGYDHMVENDKKEMREKEENILKKLNILK